MFRTRIYKAPRGIRISQAKAAGAKQRLHEVLVMAKRSENKSIPRSVAEKQGYGRSTDGTWRRRPDLYDLRPLFRRCLEQTDLSDAAVRQMLRQVAAELRSRGALGRRGDESVTLLEQCFRIGPNGELIKLFARRGWPVMPAGAIEDPRGTVRNQWRKHGIEVLAAIRQDREILAERHRIEEPEKR
jgi:hypothetical protein